MRTTLIKTVGVRMKGKAVRAMKRYGKEKREREKYKFEAEKIRVKKMLR